MKALKCIRKAGGLDNYLLKTPSEVMRSQFGELLKSYVLKKKQDPNFKVPYIPRTWKKPAKKDKIVQWYKSAIWIPKELKNEDFTRNVFDPTDPSAPPTEFEVQKEKRQEKIITAEAVDPEISKLKRRYDDDNEQTLKDMVETARAIGIDDEGEERKEEKKKDEGSGKKVRKSRSRLLYEKKMARLDLKARGGPVVPDTETIKDFRNEINRRKGKIEPKPKK